MILGTNSAFIQEENFYISNIRANNLAESIFKLSINAGPTPLDFKMVKGSIFGQSESSFKHFVLNHWEVSPFLIRRLSDTLTRQDDVFNLFIQSLNSKEDAPSFLFSKFQNLVSCPPIAADEIDILCFLKEVRNHLGFPIIYQQDIRVLKTQQSKEEVHFFQEDSGSCSPHAPQFLYADNILRCEEAYKKGYTVALRGVEFRFRSIAAIVEGLASMFGQPLAGANIYLTPPRSQGLARHCDDHCVIVCQLFGMKQWTIFPRLTHQLPRLYEPIGNWHDLEAKSSTTDGCKQFLLKEGDFLYIPRGFPHEACTIADNNEFDDNAGFSLHLTLSIEVEPPFEWQGFAHVALHHWAQKDQNCYTSSNPLSLNLNVISVNLLHVAIKLIGDYDATFRKACLVASSLWPSDTNDWLDMNQRTIFSYLIDKINSESRFSDALSWIEMDIQTNEDPLQQIRWLRYLNNGGGSSCVHNWCSHSVGIETFFQACYQHKDEVEAAFIQVKSEFCSEVIFEDVEPSYRLLLEKYKKARKQYMNGMLALHCN